MKKNHYISGEWNVICDVCSKKIKANEAKHRWDGLIVCPDDWEQRQPQDFVKAKIDKIIVPFARPVQDIVYNIEYGMFDTVTLQEDISVFITKLQEFTDTVNITESVEFNRIYSLSDIVGFSDSVVATWTANLTFSDTVVLNDSGYLYMYDYTTPAPPNASAYFAEEFVGLLQTF